MQSDVLSRVRAVVGAAVVCALAPALGCTEFEPGTDELPAGVGPAEVIAGNEPAAALGEDWSCLGDPQAQPDVLVATPLGAERLVQSLQVLSLATGVVPPGVSVRACAQRDVNCTAPLTDNLPIDAQGWVDLPLYEGFDGFLEITAETLIPTMLFYADPLSSSSQVDRTPLGVVERNVLPSLSGATGMAQDDALGLVYLRAFDCQGVAAQGVTFAIDRPGWRWYFVGGLPSSTAEETAETGLGGFINVAPGVTVVNAMLPGSNRLIQPPISVLVRPGWMTGLRFYPQAMD